MDHSKSIKRQYPTGFGCWKSVLLKGYHHVRSGHSTSTWGGVAKNTDIWTPNKFEKLSIAHKNVRWNLNFLNVPVKKLQSFFVRLFDALTFACKKGWNSGTKCKSVPNLLKKIFFHVIEFLHVFWPKKINLTWKSHLYFFFNCLEEWLSIFSRFPRVCKSWEKIFLIKVYL